MVGFLFQNPINETHERRLDLPRSVQIHQYFDEGLVVFGYIWCRSRFSCLDPVVRWRFCPDLGLMWCFYFDIYLDSTMRWSFCSNLGLVWWFWSSIWQRSGGCNSVARPIDPTVVHWRLIRLDLRLSAVGSQLFNRPPNVSRLVVGWA